MRIFCPLGEVIVEEGSRLDKCALCLLALGWAIGWLFVTLVR